MDKIKIDNIDAMLDNTSDYSVSLLDIITNDIEGGKGKTPRKPNNKVKSPKKENIKLNKSFDNNETTSESPQLPLNMNNKKNKTKSKMVDDDEETEALPKMVDDDEETETLPKIVDENEITSESPQLPLNMGNKNTEKETQILENDVAEVNTLPKMVDDNEITSESPQLPLNMSTKNIEQEVLDKMVDDNEITSESPQLPLGMNKPNSVSIKQELPLVKTAPGENDTVIVSKEYLEYLQNQMLKQKKGGKTKRLEMINKKIKKIDDEIETLLKKIKN
jgi:hypothetical protein